MPYLTTTDLLQYRSQHRFHAKANVVEAKERAQLTIFLSHSHKDRELVEGLVDFLDALGIKLYVDWNDKDMPRTTNRETAERIKAKIRENILFVIFATPNACASRWVPWETGMADQIKGEENILLIPVADSSGRFEGNEYLQLYKRFEMSPQQYTQLGQSRLRVISPNGQDLRPLNEYLKAHARTF